jgi:hypothetical protein
MTVCLQQLQVLDPSLGAAGMRVWVNEAILPVVHSGPDERNLGKIPHVWPVIIIIVIKDYLHLIRDSGEILTQDDALPSVASSRSRASCARLLTRSHL